MDEMETNWKSRHAIGLCVAIPEAFGRDLLGNVEWDFVPRPKDKLTHNCRKIELPNIFKHFSHVPLTNSRHVVPTINVTGQHFANHYRESFTPCRCCVHKNSQSSRKKRCNS